MHFVVSMWRSPLHLQHGIRLNTTPDGVMLHLQGVIHKNTGGRRKSRIAIARRKLLEDAGLYAPTAATA